MVKRKFVRFSRCDKCSLLDDKLRAKDLSTEDRAKLKAEKDRHLAQCSTERQSYYHHNRKAKTGGDHGKRHMYLSMIIDGMDQAKTYLPHFDRLPKYLDGKQQIELKLTGVMVAGMEANFTDIHWSYKHHFSSDANEWLTILDHTI